MPGPDIAHPLRHRYTVLLAVLVTTVAMQSARTAVADIAIDIVATALSVMVFLAVFRGTPEQGVMVVVLGLIVLIGWLRETVPLHHARTAALAYHGLMAVYLWSAVAAILRELFRKRRPGSQNILGAICGYLIAGAAFGSVNVIAYLLSPWSYGLDKAVTEIAADWHGRIALFSYYSYTQLITIGYADVTPVRAPATTLSLAAGIFGVFYTAVVVAQLVAVSQADRKA